jgi:hypothetical protein
VEARVVEQYLGAIPQRELAVAEVLAVIMLVILRLLGHTLFVALRIDQFANRLRTQLRRCQSFYFCASKSK